MKSWVFFLVLLLTMNSCKNKTESESSAEDTMVTLSGDSESTDKETSEEIEDCDDFINQYEEWSEDYIDFLAKYKDNPMQAFTSPEYSEMMQKASSWSQEWLTLSVSCAQNSSYEEKVKKIAENMDEKMKELGFKK